MHYLVILFSPNGIINSRFTAPVGTPVQTALLLVV